MSEHAALTPVDEKVLTQTATVIVPGDGDTAEVSIVTQNDGIPTQVANPSRASWRTFVQSAVSFLILANIALPIVQGWLVENVDGASVVLGPAYPYIVIGVNFAVLAFSLGAKLIALIMAQPKLNEWITNHLSFLAPIPQRPAVPLREVRGGAGETL